jgi:hypothetical protein
MAEAVQVSLPSFDPNFDTHAHTHVFIQRNANFALSERKEATQIGAIRNLK